MAGPGPVECRRPPGRLRRWAGAGAALGAGPGASEVAGGQGGAGERGMAQ